MDLNDTFKIETIEGVFYMIKDLGNGDYLSIDKNSAVYHMTHDPYKIKKNFNCKEDFYKHIKSENFDIENLE